MGANDFSIIALGVVGLLQGYTGLFNCTVIVSKLPDLVSDSLLCSPYANECK